MPTHAETALPPCLPAGECAVSAATGPGCLCAVAVPVAVLVTSSWEKKRVTTLTSEPPRKMTPFLVGLKCLDPGSGQTILAILHGAGAYPGVFILEPSTADVQFRVWF